MENQGVRAGRKEVERFVGQLREFGGNGRLNRRLRSTGRLVLGAALLGAALLFLTACGGDTKSASDIGGASDIGNTSKGELRSSPSASATSPPTATASPSASPESTTEESTDPISEVCQPPDMENCYDYEDMQAYLDQIIPMVEQFFDATYAEDLRGSMPHPKQYIYVSEGDTGSTGCTEDYTDEDYAYCRVDETIYIGQRALWKLYSNLGDAAPAAGLAHEWGHHVQNVVGVPPAQTSVGQISRENQADCIAGAWVDYADEQGSLDYPDDLRDIDGLLEYIAQDEPGRDHGDLNERRDSMQLGIDEGLLGCNDFFPDTPVIVLEETTTAGPTAIATTTATTTATATITATATTSGGDRVIP